MGFTHHFTYLFYFIPITYFIFNYFLIIAKHWNWKFLKWDEFNSDTCQRWLSAFFIFFMQSSNKIVKKAGDCVWQCVTIKLISLYYIIVNFKSLVSLSNRHLKINSNLKTLLFLLLSYSKVDWFLWTNTMRKPEF